jgi:hypothetical protein
MVNNQLSGLKEDIANKLSDAITSDIKESGPNLLAQSYDIFVRDTEGGKIVMNKLSMGTLLPVFAIGFLAGWLISGRMKK